MTLTELETFVKNMTFEDAADASGNSGLFTSTQLDDIINAANQKWYNRVVRASPSFYEARSNDLTYDVTSNANGYDFTSLDSNGVLQIAGVEIKYLTQYYQLDPYRPPEREHFEPTWVSPTYAFAYYIEQEKVVLTPPPTSSSPTIRIRYVPQVATMAASDQALAGKLKPYHRVIGYEAAYQLLIKDEAYSAAGAMKSLRDELAKELMSYLTARQSQKPRQVRMIHY